MKKPNVAILGATGAVGAEFITLIEERNFPYENLKLLASARSAGTELTVNGKTYVVEEILISHYLQVVLFLKH